MNPYEVLKIQSGASAAQIRAAYIEQAKRFHPDLAKGDDVSRAKEHMQQINAAYEMLISRVGGISSLDFTGDFALEYSNIQSIMNEGKLDEALAKLEALDRNDQYWHYLRGLIAFRSGDNTLAMDEFKSACEIAPDDARIALAYKMISLMDINRGGSNGEALVKNGAVMVSGHIRPFWAAASLVAIGTLIWALYSIVISLL